MRTIKFRGKRTDKDEWIYGYLADGNCICDWDNKERRSFEVKAKTIGQYTGLVDKNGKEIYEGDIVHLGDPRITYVLLWIDCGLKAKQIGAYGSFCGVTYWAETMTIVGNIHDNPELMKI